MIKKTILILTLIITSCSGNINNNKKIEINGTKVSLNQCVKGTKKMISSKKERKSFCECFLDKILSDSISNSKYSSELEKGHFLKVMQEIKKNKTFINLDIDNCFLSVDASWTDNIENTVIKSLKQQYKGSKLEQTNDIDKHCNCLVKEYKKYPVSKIMNDDFLKSKESLDIYKKCREKSKKK